MGYDIRHAAHRATALAAALLLPLAAPGLAAPAIAAEAQSAAGQTGEASYFSTEMAGRRTASGELCNPATLTAAHRTLPLGSFARVTDLASGREVVVRINDRGPFARGRVIDLSRSAADALGITRRGRAQVSVSPVGAESAALSAPKASGPVGAQALAALLD